MSTPKHTKTEDHYFDSEHFQIRISKGSGKSHVEFVQLGSGGVSWSGPYESFVEWAGLARFAVKQLETPAGPVNRDIGLYAPGTK